MKVAVTTGRLLLTAGATLLGPQSVSALSRVQDGEAANTTAPSAPTGCQSRSTREYWEKGATRTWTPAVNVATSPEQTPGRRYGTAFRARLVRAFGSDHGDFHRIVTLEMPDGCRRNFRVDGFVGADRAFVATTLAKHPTIVDKRRYRFTYVDGIATPAMVASGKLRFKTTPHFVIWYGVNRKGEYYAGLGFQHMSHQQMLKNIETSLEKAWYLGRDIVGAPMPFANDALPRKLHVFLCGSGRPGIDGGDMASCVPSAAEHMALPALSIGNSAIPHELAHMVQFYTGGFRDWAKETAIWETAAQWHSTTSGVGPYYTGTYIRNLHTGPFSPIARYEKHPVLSFLAERDDTHDLVYRAWTKNRRDAKGRSEEGFVDAFVRLAGETGAYANGYLSFADDMGWYGARLVTMDFLDQRAWLDARHFAWPKIPGYKMPTDNIDDMYTVLPSVAGDPPGSYASPANRPLRPWGTHLVPLKAQASTVEISLTGGTSANDAAWRFALVAVAPGDGATYSTLGRAAGTGTGKSDIKVPKGARLFLAVTATPYSHDDPIQQGGNVMKEEVAFPYRVQMKGAVVSMP